MPWRVNLMSIKSECLKMIKSSLSNKYRFINLHDDVYKPENLKKPSREITSSESSWFQLFYKYNAVKVTEYEGWYDVEFANGQWCYVYKY